MWVLNKNKTEIINLDRAKKVFLEPTGRGEVIMASVESGREKIEEYSDKKKAEFALGRLFEAIAHGEL